jgi:hypothetical protein
MKRGAGVLVMVALLAGPIGYLFVRHDVTRASLSHSVASRFGGFGDCGRKSARVWQCDVVSQEQSDGWGPYNVILSGSCWHGTLVRSSRYASGAHAISGCIGIGDQLRIADRLGLTILNPPPGYY